MSVAALRSVYRKSLLYDVHPIISFCIYYDIRLSIVLFVGQHFSGSLFCSITLLLLTRRRTKRPLALHPCPLMNALLVSHPCLVSHRCRCVLQRLSVADFKHPCLKPSGIHARPRKRVRFCCSVKPSQLWWGLKLIVLLFSKLLICTIPFVTAWKRRRYIIVRFSELIC